MPTITDAYKKVPLMFQAQTNGRCQLQRIDSDRTKNGQKQDVEIWTEQWIEKTEDRIPELPCEPSTISAQNEYQISWRFVTNGGQDDGIIRPVIGTGGVPFYPGSSMKGAFRQACRKIAPDKVDDYCGSPDNPAQLRFHGGYPIDDSWQENLIDLTHPQQEWQVKTQDTSTKPKGESAFALISLYKPKLKFGISSSKSLEETDWDNIWNIWKKAVENGLGCRVSSGYGQPEQLTENVIFQAHIEGQGMAPKTIGGESEFRPNIFKASLRGHALRLFGGLTNKENAEMLVEKVFGGVEYNKGSVGLLAMSWENKHDPIWNEFDGGYKETIYKVKGIVKWIQTQELTDEKRKSLLKLLKVLMRFSMLFGGYGKSWRRIDHDLFYRQYYQTGNRKPAIGCHWKWRDKSLDKFNLILSPNQVTGFLNNAQEVVKEWMKLEGITSQPSDRSDWRETWYQGNVQVWGRVAENSQDSEAVPWFHGSYRQAIREIQKEGSIYRSDFGGSMSQISRIWHRMYPLAKRMRNRRTEKIELRYPSPPKPQQYLELLTIFPDGSTVSNEFLQFLGSKQSSFLHLW